MGGRPEEMLDHVRERIRAEGPLKSVDFEHEGERGTWWAWKPAKAALECLWRTGELAIAGREHFAKRYDLAERVHPEAHALPVPEPDAQLEWACATAAERLVVFTPRELADFWNEAPIESTRRWCAEALREGRVVPVEVEAADGAAPQPAFALADWLRRLQRTSGATGAPAPALPLRSHPAGPRPLPAPLRLRLPLRGFHAGAQAPVRLLRPADPGGRTAGGPPGSQGASGQGVLEVRGLWWEPGIRPTKARLRRLREALEGLAAFTGAGELQGV